MAKAAEVNVAFNAQMEGWGNSLKKGRKDLDDFGKDVKKSKGQLDELKKTFGEESQFGAVMKILGGAGAIAGLGMAAREAQKFSQEITKIKDEMYKGADGGQLAAELLKSLPVVGPLGESVANIRAELDGSADAARKLKTETASITAGSDYAVARMQAMKEHAMDLSQLLRESQASIDAIGKSTADKALLDLGEQQRKKLEAADKEVSEKEKGIRERAAGARAAYDEEFRAKEKAMRDAADNLATAEQRQREGVQGSSLYDSVGTASQKFKDAKAQFNAIANARSAFAAQEQSDLDKLRKDRADLDVKTEEETAKKKLEIERQFLAEIAQAQAQADAKRVDSQIQHQSEMARMAAEATQDRLKLQGRDHDAELAAIANAAQDQRQEAAGRLAETIADGGLSDFGRMAQEMDQAAEKLAAIQNAQSLKEQDALKRANEEKRQIQAEFDRDRIERANKTADDLEAIQADMRDADLRRSGKDQLADTEKARREMLSKQRELAAGIADIPLTGDASMFGEFTRMLALGSAIKGQFDQGEAARGNAIAPLPTAIERRFDYTIPGVDNPALIPEKQLAALQKIVAQGPSVVAAINALANKAVPILGIP